VDALAAAPGIARTTSRQWLVWLALTAIAWGATAQMFRFGPTFGLGAPPLWAILIQYKVEPAVAIAAVITPLIAAGALILKRWRGGILLLLGFVAAAQLACVGFEFYVRVRPDDSMSAPAFEGWPQ
jgi:hypothetical protein